MDFETFFIKYAIPTIFISAGIIIFFGLAVVPISREIYCRNLGFQYNSQDIVEQGYISCCNNTYTNHIKTGESCKALKYTSEFEKILREEVG
jgi:hypothetical protein